MGKDGVMSASEQERFISHMEAQGATVSRTKKGYTIQAPEGGVATVHLTNSDRRSVANDIARFRRIGLAHPEDKRGSVVPERDEDYPAYLRAPISARTRQRAMKELEDRGWPLRVRARQFEMDDVTASKALFHIGYRWDPRSTAGKRYWLAPPDIRKRHEEERDRVLEPEEVADILDPRPVVEIELEKDDETPEPCGARAEEGPCVLPRAHNMGQLDVPSNHSAGKPTPPPEPEREFIDTHDSWVVTNPPPEYAVGEYLELLRGAGLEVEIRVWKRP